MRSKLPAAFSSNRLASSSQRRAVFLDRIHATHAQGRAGYRPHLLMDLSTVGRAASLKTREAHVAGWLRCRTS